MPSKSKKDKSFPDFLANDIWRGKPRTRTIAVSKTIRRLADGREIPVRAYTREIEQ
jgi:hypothetical protein